MAKLFYSKIIIWSFVYKGTLKLNLYFIHKELPLNELIIKQRLLNYLILEKIDQIILREIRFLNTPITYVNAAARRIV